MGVMKRVLKGRKWETVVDGVMGNESDEGREMGGDADGVTGQ